MAYDDNDTGNALIFGGGGVPSVLWKNKPVGAKVSGYVVAPPQARQVLDFVTKEPKFYQGGDPIMQAVIRIQTDDRDPSIESDDGVRAAYIKGSNLKRLREAVKRGGASSILPGGFLVQTFTGEGKPSAVGLSGEKLFDFTYQPPAAQGDAAEAKPIPAAASAAPVPSTSPVVEAPDPLAGLNDQQRALLAQLGINK